MILSLALSTDKKERTSTIREERSSTINVCYDLLWRLTVGMNNHSKKKRDRRFSFSFRFLFLRRLTNREFYPRVYSMMMMTVKSKTDQTCLVM